MLIMPLGPAVPLALAMQGKGCWLAHPSGLPNDLSALPRRAWTSALAPAPRGDIGHEYPGSHIQGAKTFHPCTAHATIMGVGAECLASALPEMPDALLSAFCSSLACSGGLSSICTILSGRSSLRSIPAPMLPSAQEQEQSTRLCLCP
jgi:hypothetical protein